MNVLNAERRWWARVQVWVAAQVQCTKRSVSYNMLLHTWCWAVCLWADNFIVQCVRLGEFSQLMDLVHVIDRDWICMPCLCTMFTFTAQTASWTLCFWMKILVVFVCIVDTPLASSWPHLRCDVGLEDGKC